jgi:YVTN family beta-propeller protein
VRSGTKSVVTHTVAVGSQPFAVAITPDGRKAVVANYGGTSISIIDVAAGSVDHTVTVGPAPTDVAISPDGSTAYVVVYGTFGDTATSALQWVDIATGTITCTVRSGPLGSYPTSVIVSPDGLFLYVYSTVPSQWLAKVRVSDGEVISPIYSFGGSSISHAALSPDGSTIAISPFLRTGTIQLVATSTMLNIRTLSLDISGGYMSYAKDGTSLFVTDRSENQVVVIDTSTYSVTRWASDGAAPNGLVTAASGRVYVSNSDSNSVASLSNGAAQSVSSISSPQIPVLTEEQDRILVPAQSGNALAIIEASNFSLEMVSVGASPWRVATARGFAVVSNQNSNSVSIVRLGIRPASGDQVPTAPLQQFSRMENETCSDHIPDSVLFPGVGENQRAESWAMSWAEWPNHGKGGFVCSRQPYYTNLGNWAVD